MTSDTPSLTGLGAEAGYDDPDDVAPVRVSGFFALLFGVISVFSFMGRPLLAFPLLAVGLGFLALRATDGKPPVGVTAAKLGLILGIGFGAFGFALPWLKQQTLCTQAEEFSLQYLRLVGSGDDMLAQQLGKDFLNRLPDSMSLVDYYTQNPNAQQHLQLFQLTPLNRDLKSWGPDVDWKLAQPTRVEYHYGRQQAEVVWQGPPGTERVQFFMSFRFDADGVGQWYVETVQYYRERVVAEKVL